MDVVRSEWFWAELTAQLEDDGRPTMEQFEAQLGQAVELTLRFFWDDPTKVLPVDLVPEVRTVQTITSRNGMFPPGVFYVRHLDNDTVELIGVDFDWGYWDLIATDPDD
jgi:hypothetical protein